MGTREGGRKMELNIKKGHAVAFDFDGVIHKIFRRLERWEFL